MSLQIIIYNYLPKRKSYLYFHIAFCILFQWFVENALETVIYLKCFSNFVCAFMENSWGNFETESNIVNSENKEAFVLFLCYYAGSRENYGHRLDLFGHAQISQGIGFVCSSWSCMKLWHLSLSDSSSILET